MDPEREDYADREPPAVPLIELASKWPGPAVVVVIGAAAVWFGYWLDTNP